jgi:H+/Cl- antiporter ClcA
MTSSYTLEESVRMQGWHMNDWFVVVAKFLGWNEPGFVIMIATIIGIIAFAILFPAFIVWMYYLADECRYNAEDNSGLESFCWYLIMMVPLIIGFVCELIVAVLFIWAAYESMKSFRSWWHREF